MMINTTGMPKITINNTNQGIKLLRAVTNTFSPKASRRHSFSNWDSELPKAI
jgi:hypothetical protein